MDDRAHLWFHDVVSALAYSFAQAHAPGAPPSLAADFWEKPSAGKDGGASGKLLPPYNDLTQFVLRQQAQMPDYLRAPMIAATLAFDLFGCLRTGRLFHSRPPAVRARQIAAWKRSKLGFQRDLTRYYESLATFALYSRPANVAQASRLRVPHEFLPSPAGSEGQLALPGLASSFAFMVDATLQAFGMYHQKIHVLSEMNKTIACSVSKAEAELGYRPSVDLEEGMRRSLAWCVAQGIQI